MCSDLEEQAFDRRHFVNQPFADSDVATNVVSKLIADALAPEERNVKAALRHIGIVVRADDFDSILQQVRQQLDGYGPLEQFFRSDVTDVLVMPDQSVWIDDATGLHQTDVWLQSDHHTRQIAVRLAHLAHRRLDDAHPWVDAQLPDGKRLHAILAPTSTGGAALSLRIPLASPRPLAELLQGSHNSVLITRRVHEIIETNQSFVVSGATGSGKTTLLRSMLMHASATQRIITIEDIAELNLNRPNIISLQGRIANAEGAGHISLQDLVRQSLRMRPDRIVVGELRGTEALDWLLAVSSGHQGCATTVHAHSASDVVGRLELLCGLSGIDLGVARHIIANSIDVLIHCQRVNGQRVISEIQERRDIHRLLKIA